MKELNCDQVVSEFVDLLSSKGALKPYMAYVAEYHYVPCDPNAESLVSTAFTWRSTPEGHVFWKDVSACWVAYFRSLE